MNDVKRPLRVVYGLSVFSVYFVAMLKRAFQGEVILCPMPGSATGISLTNQGGAHPTDPRSWPLPSDVIFCDLELAKWPDELGEYGLLMEGIGGGDHNVLMHLETEMPLSLERLQRQFESLGIMIEANQFRLDQLEIASGQKLEFDDHCRQLLDHALTAADENAGEHDGLADWVVDILLEEYGGRQQEERHLYLLELLVNSLTPDRTAQAWVLEIQSRQLTEGFNTDLAVSRARRYPGDVYVVPEELTRDDVTTSDLSKALFAAGARAHAFHLHDNGLTPWLITLSDSTLAEQVVEVLAGLDTLHERRMFRVSAENIDAAVKRISVLLSG